MGLNKNGIDLSAIRKDQKAIDKLPNKGRYVAKSKALTKAKGGVLQSKKHLDLIKRLEHNKDQRFS